MSIKLDFKPTELASKEKLRKQFKKIKTYYDKFFINLKDLDDDDDDNLNVEDDNINEDKKDEKVENKEKENNTTEEKKESK